MFCSDALPLSVGQTQNNHKTQGLPPEEQGKQTHRLSYIRFQLQVFYIPINAHVWLKNQLFPSYSPLSLYLLHKMIIFICYSNQMSPLIHEAHRISFLPNTLFKTLWTLTMYVKYLPYIHHTFYQPYIHLKCTLLALF